MALWDRLKGGIVGGAIGFAARDALEPAFEPVKQEGWFNNRNKVLPAELAAALHAEDGPDPTQLLDDVRRQGFSDGRYAALVEYARTAPGLGELLSARRRGQISDAQLVKGLRKHKIPAEWDDAIRNLLSERLDPAVIALAIVRGIMAAPFPLPVPPPTATGKVPAFPMSPLDAQLEAEAAGIDLPRLFVETALAGRPMSPEAAAAAVFRGIIEPADYDRAIAEGDVRNEWAGPIFETARYVLSPADAAGLRLRGWKSRDEAQLIGDLHGASPETMDDLYLNRGRPATTHQVHIGYARGGSYIGENLTEREAFARAVKNSDIRPEYEDILWAGRYTMPSAFVLRALTQDGTFTEAQADEILVQSGWRPDLAADAAKKWAGSGAGPTTKWLDRARSRLFTTAHNEFLSLSIDDSQADSLLAQLGASAAERPAIIELWTAERIINRLELTPAQIKKAYKAALYTEPVALASLEERGMTPDDAQTFLDE